MLFVLFENVLRSKRLNRLTPLKERYAVPFWTASSPPVSPQLSIVLWRKIQLLAPMKRTRRKLVPLAPLVFILRKASPSMIQ